jgi:hypothetical protein
MIEIMRDILKNEDATECGSKREKLILTALAQYARRRRRSNPFFAT